MRNVRSAILTYHSIDDSGSVISTSADQFARQMESLAVSSIPVVPLNEVLHRPGSVAITFDDGFRNFRTAALPSIERYQFPATIFVISGFCGRSNQWAGQSPRVPNLPLLDWDELQGLAQAGFDIGSHTVHHPDLRKLSSQEAMREMSDSKAEIEQRIGRPVKHFAYPYGYVPSQVQPPFQLACGTQMSYVQSESNRLDLPRLDAYYFRTGSSLGSLFSGATSAYVGARATLRSLRQWLSP